MKSIPIREAKNRLTELARDVENGETIVVTRNGRPIFDMTPHRKHSVLDFAAGRAFLHARGLRDPAPVIAPDFDEPAQEDFLLRPMTNQQ